MAFQRRFFTETDGTEYVTIPAPNPVYAELGGCEGCCFTHNSRGCARTPMCVADSVWARKADIAPEKDPNPL